VKTLHKMGTEFI